ncbi:uncharacterized protein GVI51_J01441 [Nakaseomyces glabratus]|uniref:PHD-type domain-containing protein n=1 Tax=Candida glabrata (strain ATCC 2001 / BCRC 20586 / JCM 3761 / NBRC 0622 / NRRL Y-65 / CBS 138) TaxID=284593 RepID=Q6FPR6_CANGA|nr:uncharacterized protein CAGL0J01529g [Nakaseomyces glabratus]KAH7585941.1 PHD-finger [Nakaseomyces glabratus]KAH7588103.1 PHD-finger [Nakaseomyces glabratus]KAH7599046.1 PHD-finger [Nakaseomyces glabratus]KAH7603624.1 PHD-finger [Nakaseomyces glabratus]KAI8395185.1 PHD-finger [Nakaseomyces glabratus]|eukprot:XP_447778.1 uncharacterized protein CAGL0J01529g [[Candida] glabrata]
MSGQSSNTSSKGSSVTPASDGKTINGLEKVKVKLEKVNERGRSRPKRSSSQNVDYDLKKRKIITEDLNLGKKNGDQSEAGSTGNGTPTGSTNGPEFKAEDIIEYNRKGEIVKVNEPPTIETVNGANGIPLSQFPPDKVKKEYLWNFKKSNSGQYLLSAAVAAKSSKDNEEKPNFTERFEQLLLQAKATTEKERELTKPSHIRHQVKSSSKTEHVLVPKGINLHNPHIKTKLKDTHAFDSKTKLISQNPVGQMNDIAMAKKKSSDGTTQEIENDDYCSACFQTGSFLCCDTCPKSFHFLCLNPPLDPDHLPEGDWSCPQCMVKLRYANNTQYLKAQKAYTAQMPKGKRLFGKLLFSLQGTNPRQFNLPNFIKETFQSVKTGPRGQYSDDTIKEPLSDKPIFNSPYGQSITKLDSYNLDSHIDQTTGKILTCYRCGVSRLGSWSHPEEARLLIKCDYCNTRWHLDCVPEVPRASLKNLGSKWQCPLHSEPPNTTKFDDQSKIKKSRKLIKNQRYMEPLQSCGYRNEGNIEVALDEISALPPKNARNINVAYKPIPLLNESNFILDFEEKLRQVKENEFRKSVSAQSKILEQLMCTLKKDEKEDIMTLLQFRFKKSKELKQLWDFSELTSKLNAKIQPQNETKNEDIQALLALKKIIESKPKEEILRFLDLSDD